MSELITSGPISPTDLQRAMGIKPDSPQASRLLETNVDANLNRLRNERDELVSKSSIGRFAVKGRINSLSEQIDSEQAVVERAKERTEQALNLIRYIPSPANQILRSDEKEEPDGVTTQVARYNDKLHAQSGPGLLEQSPALWTEHEQHGSGSCVLCGAFITDRTTTFVGFRDTHDVSMSDNPTSLSIKLRDRPGGEVTTVSLSNDEKHGLSVHPLLAESQEVASRVLKLQPYANPGFDGRPDVTTDELGSPL